MGKVVGVKAYGYDWCSEFSVAEAASLMVSQGIDWALVQNQIDPLPGSAVSQQPPGGSYTDLAWRNALGDRDIRVFESTSVFFDPVSFAADPSLRPVDQHGVTFEPFGWYVGVCPSDRSYLSRKADLVASVVSSLRPDGVFLSFIRFPGFWELWMPDTPRASISEYCFCARCVSRFAYETGNETTSPQTILAELRPEWTAWKCAIIAEAASVLRSAALDVDPSLDVLLNGFGLGAPDYSNAVEEVLGQRFSALDPYIDYYELMFYFQIQRRSPYPYVSSRIAEARGLTSRPLLACIQGGPEYLEPEFASGGRARVVTDADFRDALRGAAEADGVLVYSWRDLLAEPSRVLALRDYKSEVLQ